MHLSEVKVLVSDLLRTGQMNDDTSVDLYRMLAEAKSNRLDADDLRYLRALHAKILGNRADRRNSGTAGSTKSTESPEEIRKLRAQLDSANRTIAELRKELKYANATIDDLRRKTNGNVSIDSNFRELFKEFWHEFDKGEI